MPASRSSSDGEQFRTHFVHGFLETVEGIDWNLKTKMGIRNNRYVVDVPTVTGRPKRSRPGASRRGAFCRVAHEARLKFTLPGPMTICDTLADAHFGRRADMAMAFAECSTRRRASSKLPASTSSSSTSRPSTSSWTT